MEIEVKEEKEQPKKKQLPYFHLEFSETNFNELVDKQSYYLMIYHKIYQLIHNQELTVYEVYPSHVTYQAGMCFVIKRQPYMELFRIIKLMNGQNYVDRKTGLRKKPYYLELLAYLDGYFEFDHSLKIRIVKFFDTKNRNKDFLMYFDLFLIHIYRQENYLEKDSCDSYQSSQFSDFAEYTEGQMECDDSDYDFSQYQQSQQLKNNYKIITKSQTQIQNQIFNQTSAQQQSAETEDQIIQKNHLQLNEVSVEKNQLNTKEQIQKYKQWHQDQQSNCLITNQKNKQDSIEGQNRQVSIKNKKNEQKQRQLGYFILEFSENNFKKLQNKEGYYLKIFNHVQDLVKEKQIKIYKNYPDVDQYEAGMCFVLKRPSNSSFDTIFKYMNAIFYRNEQGYRQGVQYIGKLSYNDGQLKFQKNLGIRVVKFVKYKKNKSTEGFNQTGIILIHFYELDFKETNNTEKINNQVQKIIQTDLVQTHSCEQIEQDESEISEKKFNPSFLKKQNIQKQNQTKESKLQEIQNDIEVINKEKVANESNSKETVFKSSSEDAFSENQIYEIRQQDFQQFQKPNLANGFKQMFASEQRDVRKVIDEIQKLENLLSASQQYKQDEFNQIKQMFISILRENNNHVNVINQKDMLLNILEYQILEQKQQQINQVEEYLTKQLNNNHANFKSSENINKN